MSGYGWYGLKPGDRLKVTKGTGKNKETRRVTVVKEYLYFVIVDMGRYETSINKSSVYTNEVKLTRL